MMAMMSSLSGLFFLLLSSTVSGLGSVVWRTYTYHASHRTWEDAQSFCRRSNYHTDLASIYTQSEIDPLNLKQHYSWIGLKRLYNNTWIWSNGETDYFNNWENNEPHYNEDCAFVSYNTKKFHGGRCEGHLFFICHNNRYDNSILNLPNYNYYFDYTFIPQSKTWSEAQQYCKDNFDDLATFRSYNLDSAVNLQDFPVWTGLHRDGEVWKWSAGLLQYRKWASDEPRDNGDCVSISSVSKTMATQKCSDRFPFICIRDNLILVKENKTWEEALEHCRSLKTSLYPHYSYELVSVQPGEDHNYMMNKVMEANTEKVWTGLRFLAGHWLWVNRADMSYPDLSLCPLEEQHCGALSKNNTGSVETTDCTEKLNFLCYGKY
ncbi:macrophage mannose receptor 1-like isoform X3 [Dicentrarchus labrax]|uniref:macrophage mannose receptor 1-like isoform X2 n=1 Tax=Dicentrarchus labrax TaxID=13489 RepID=UPI0021F662E5|nr:macrophage mannose receptor 1-like isoform X2 [Dicentrarchus labrax]XP_051236328.1 macrophage mannose receptor 1-like isoform X3 [Dicentrarchus labrax]